MSPKHEPINFTKAPCSSRRKLKAINKLQKLCFHKKIQVLFKSATSLLLHLLGGEKLSKKLTPYIEIITTEVSYSAIAPNRQGYEADIKTNLGDRDV